MSKAQRFDSTAISNSANVILMIVLGILALICLLPVLLVYIISFTSENAISMNGYSFFPKELSFGAYDYLLKTGEQILISYGVTIFVTVVGSLLGLFVISMFAYVISRNDFKYRRIFSFFVFFTMLFNGGMVPSYIINVNIFHLNDKIWALILPLLVNGFYIMILRTFYATTIPGSIIEAAKIDGAGELRTFFQIVFPLSKPGLATVGLFLVIGFWNDWMQAMLYITDQKLAPIQYTLMKVQNNLEFVKQASQFMNTTQALDLANKTPTDSAQMALTVLVITPLLMAYPFFRKYFVKGLTIGGVKG